MRCSNCGNLIPDDAKSCLFCGVYITTSIDDDVFDGYYLEIRGFKFKLKTGCDAHVFIGRKDISNSPDIDIGPFDNALSVSRVHGFFIEKNGKLYYTDLSRNGTTLNGVRIKKKMPVLVNSSDKISFSGVNGEIVKK